MLLLLLSTGELETMISKWIICETSTYCTDLSVVKVLCASCLNY